MCPVNIATSSSSSIGSGRNIRSIPDMRILSVGIAMGLLLSCHTQTAAATASRDTINIGFLAEYSEMRVSVRCNR